MFNLTYKDQYRRHLPHIQPPGVTFFVTFRLAGSIPGHLQQQLRSEAVRVKSRLAGIVDTDERARQAYLEQRRWFGRWDKILDTLSDGPLWLERPEIAQIVKAQLHYLHNQLYDLDAFCIMPNHVHTVFTPLQKDDGSYHALSAIMHSLKGATAFQANRRLDRQGAFWQHESYDHGIRDETEWRRILTYILNNPVKAGLALNWQAWQWNYCKYDDIQ